jgi:hypothetical protein
MVTKTAEAVETSTEMTQPVIIDLGRQKSKYIKDLKEGQGKLWDEVFDVVDEVKEMLGQEADGKMLIPVVMLYEKQRRIDLNRVLFPLLDRDMLGLDDDDENDEDEEE